MGFLPHQVEGIKAALPVIQKNGGFYFAWDPGMGKTLGWIATAKLLGARRILVLAPIVALGVWEREVKKWWPEAKTTVLRDSGWNSPLGTPSIPTSSATGKTKRAARPSTRDGDAAIRFVLTNYDQLVGKNGRARVTKLLKMGFDLLILDEFHYAKSPTSQRTRAVLKLSQEIRWKIGGSGTPSHSPLDWWAQFRVIAPNEPMWAQKFGEYKKTIAFLGGPTGNWVQAFNPVAKAQALKAIVPYTHVAKVELLKLPAPIYTIVPVELSENERNAYRQMERLLFVEIEGEEVMSAQIVLTKILRLQQITAGHLSDKGVGSSKLAAALELIDQRRSKKVIVAARFDWELDQLRAALKKAKRPFLEVRGSTSQAERGRVQDSFQTVDSPFVLLLNYRAGGVSLTLTAADAMILYSLTPSLIDYQQMIGRVYRIGQKTHVQILPLLAKESVDEEVFMGLERKASDEDLAKLIKEGMKARQDGQKS